MTVRTAAFQNSMSSANRVHTPKNGSPATMVNKTPSPTSSSMGVTTNLTSSVMKTKSLSERISIFESRGVVSSGGGSNGGSRSSIQKSTVTERTTTVISPRCVTPNESRMVSGSGGNGSFHSQSEDQLDAAPSPVPSIRSTPIKIQTVTGTPEVMSRQQQQTKQTPDNKKAAIRTYSGKSIDALKSQFNTTSSVKGVELNHTTVSVENNSSVNIQKSANTKPSPTTKQSSTKGTGVFSDESLSSQAIKANEVNKRSVLDRYKYQSPSAAAVNPKNGQGSGHQKSPRSLNVDKVSTPAATPFGTPSAHAPSSTVINSNERCYPKLVDPKSSAFLMSKPNGNNVKNDAREGANTRSRKGSSTTSSSSKASIVLQNAPIRKSSQKLTGISTPGITVSGVSREVMSSSDDSDVNNNQDIVVVKPTIARGSEEEDALEFSSTNGLLSSESRFDNVGVINGGVNGDVEAVGDADDERTVNGHYSDTGSLPPNKQTLAFTQSVEISELRSSESSSSSSTSHSSDESEQTPINTLEESVLTDLEGDGEGFNRVDVDHEDGLFTGKTKKVVSQEPRDGFTTVNGGSGVHRENGFIEASTDSSITRSKRKSSKKSLTNGFDNNNQQLQHTHDYNEMKNNYETYEVKNENSTFVTSSMMQQDSMESINNNSMITISRKLKKEMELKIREQEDEIYSLTSENELLEEGKARLESSLSQFKKDHRRELGDRDEQSEQDRLNAQRRIKAIEHQLELEHEERMAWTREKHELESKLKTSDLNGSGGRNGRSTVGAGEESDRIVRYRKELRRTKALLRDAQLVLERQQGGTVYFGSGSPNCLGSGGGVNSSNSTNLQLSTSQQSGNSSLNSGFIESSASSLKVLIRQLKNQLEESEQGRTQAVKGRLNTKLELNDVQTQLDDVLRSKCDVEDRLIKVVREKADYQTAVDELNDEMCEVMKKFKVSVNQVSVCQITLQDQANTISELEEERNRLREQLASNSLRIQMLEKEGLVSSCQHTRLEMKVKELESHLDLERVTRSRMDNTIQRLKDHIDKLNLQCDQASKKEQSDQELIRQIQKQLRDLKEDYASLQSREIDINSKKNEMEKALEFAEAEVALIRNETKFSAKRIDDLQAALRKVSDDSDSSESLDDSEDDDDNSSSTGSMDSVNDRLDELLDDSNRRKFVEINDSNSDLSESNVINEN